MFKYNLFIMNYIRFFNQSLFALCTLCLLLIQITEEPDIRPGRRDIPKITIKL